MSMQIVMYIFVCLFRICSVFDFNCKITKKFPYVNMLHNIFTGYNGKINAIVYQILIQLIYVNNISVTNNHNSDAAHR